MSGASDIGKCNSYAMEKMKAIDEQERLEKMHTKQKAGTPTVSFVFRINVWYLKNGKLNFNRDKKMTFKTTFCRET